MTNLIENHNCFQTKTGQKPYPQGSGTEMGNTGESFFKSGERLGSRVSFICRYWIISWARARRSWINAKGWGTGGLDADGGACPSNIVSRCDRVLFLIKSTVPLVHWLLKVSCKNFFATTNFLFRITNRLLIFRNISTTNAIQISPLCRYPKHSIKETRSRPIVSSFSQLTSKARKFPSLN